MTHTKRCCKFKNGKINKYHTYEEMNFAMFFACFYFQYFKEFYANKNSEELKIKQVDEADSGYFAVKFNKSMLNCSSIEWAN